jgi:hypothetical protein
MSDVPRLLESANRKITVASATAAAASARRRHHWKVMLPLWLAIAGLSWLGLYYQVDVGVIAGGVFVVGLVSDAFAWLLGVITLVPLIGPLIVKVLSIGFVWLLNAVGTLASFIAIRRGYSQDVLTYRGLTMALIVGVVIGYLMGKLF